MEQNYLDCHVEMDFDVEPCQENYGRIQNFPFEDGLGQPYKPTSYVELQLCHLQLLLGLVCIFPLLEYACFHQVCTIQRCVQVCDLEITSQILVSNFLQYVKLVELAMV
jgi:hypothetical protein